MVFPYKTVENLDCAGKRVLVRSDLNVPLKDGQITDDARITASLPTIEYLSKKGAKVIVLSHLGRPDGKFVADLSLKPVAERMSELMGRKILFAIDCVGDGVKDIIGKMVNGDVLLLENTRFHPGDEANDIKYAGELAELGDIFVNDAFGTAHRAHASNVGLAKQLGGAYTGLLMKVEIKELTKLLEETSHPYIVVIGGAKVKTKLGVVKNLLKIADNILIGGGASYTLLKAEGVNVGKSLVSNDMLPKVSELLKSVKGPDDKIKLPEDHIAVSDYTEDAEAVYVQSRNIPENLIGIDIGPETTAIFKDILSEAKMIVWNGPMGVFEWKTGETGTREIAETIANSNAYSVVGGGDTISAMEQFGLQDKFSHICTGGGAMLEFLEGKTLPGIDCLIRV